ncbi:Meiotic activator RIM4 [Colletotrichum chlorophyti]|uniref:Meiotic activator RIM4 n=1 Tax=Colletotrichum chlorophyti TaxID=708187 RepID=A0A1Q8RP80_9PEZI|nr:Meiotic activator RIM4 [Colletotrichum chlorophyti]
MSSSNDKMLLEHLQKLSLAHERETDAVKAASANTASGSQNADSAPDRAAAMPARKSPNVSSASSEDLERGGGVRLNVVSSLGGSSTSFSRRSEAAGIALRPTSSATAAVQSNKPLQIKEDEDDPFKDTTGNLSRSTNMVVSSASYSLGRAHLNTNVQGQDTRRNEYVGGSPIKKATHTYGDPNDPQTHWPTTACIFVANLPDNRDDNTLEAAVEATFSKFGEVYVKIRRDSQGMPFAFVQFEDDESANDARINGKGSLILGRPCRTETVRANRTYIIFRRDRTPITIAEANELLSPFGAIETVRLLDHQIQNQMRLPVTIRVQFEVFDPTQQVLRAFRMNRCYKVEAYDFKKAMQVRSRDPEQTQVDNLDRDSRSIFMGDLPLYFTEADIRSLMEDVGGVVSVHTKRLQYQREGPKLIAFVEFTNSTLPDMAIQRYHLNDVDGHTIRVERRAERRRGSGLATPGRIQGNAFTGPLNGHGNGPIGGRPPSTPGHDQRGTLAIEAGPPVRAPAMVGTASGPTNHNGMPVNAGPSPPHFQITSQPWGQVNNHSDVHHFVPPYIQQQQAIPQVQQMAQPQQQMQMQPQMQSGMHQTNGPVFNQPQVQYPMAPPPLPSQISSPMAHGVAGSPFPSTPYSQGAFSQGPGSSYGFITPQQSPMGFWGYGHGTPLWTPFPVEQPTTFVAYSSPVPPPRSGSEPIMADNPQANSVVNQNTNNV